MLFCAGRRLRIQAFKFELCVSLPATTFGSPSLKCCSWCNERFVSRSPASKNRFMRVSLANISSSFLGIVGWPKIQVGPQSPAGGCCRERCGTRPEESQIRVWLQFLRHADWRLGSWRPCPVGYRGGLHSDSDVEWDRQVLFHYLFAVLCAHVLHSGLAGPAMAMLHGA